MRHAHAFRVGPVGFRVGADWRAPIALLKDLYAGYPPPRDGVPDFTVRLEAPRPWRRWLRPQVAIAGDFQLPGAVPLPLAHALLAAEMAMNLQVALGWRRHLLLHAAAVERDGQVLVMTGESGAGKSTMAALLALNGWRLLGDEFALIAPDTGWAHPFPRLISLKNDSIAAIPPTPTTRCGPQLSATPKGDVRHLVPDAAAVAAMDRSAPPALLVFPRFGAAAATRPVSPSEAFVRLTEASTNYVAMGEAGFRTLTRLVTTVPAIAIDYPDGAAGLSAAEAAWARR